MTKQPAMKRPVYLLLACTLLIQGSSWAIPAKADGIDTLSFVPGKAEFISSNAKAWAAHFQLLKNAQHSILATYFAVSGDDVFGRSFLALLAQKAREGKEVKLLVDARGSFRLATQMFYQAELQELVNAGAEVRVFNPFLVEGVNFHFVTSTHQKLLLVDDRYFITGGRNISQKYFWDASTSYLDADILVDSPEMAPKVREAFFVDFNNKHNFRVSHHEFLDPKFLRGWDEKDLREVEKMHGAVPYLAMNHALEAMENRFAHSTLSADDATAFPDLSEHTELYGTYPFEPFQQMGNDAPYNLQLLYNTSKISGGRHEITDTLLSLIDRAQDEIVIRNPYVVLPKQVRAALQRAAERNVKIVLSTNGPTSTDSILTESFIIHNWRKVLGDIPTMQLYMEPGPRKLHAKVFIFDRKEALIGSYNLDNLSDHVNSEIAVLVDSPSFAENTRAGILDRIYTSDFLVSLKNDLGPAEIPGSANAVTNLDSLYNLVSSHLEDLL